MLVPTVRGQYQPTTSLSLSLFLHTHSGSRKQEARLLEASSCPRPPTPLTVSLPSHRCAPGFYGNPMVIGSTCQPCRCHDNTDPNMLFSDCHPLTGECQGCMHDAAGPHCEICAPGYYGDAVDAKNCTSELRFVIHAHRLRNKHTHTDTH